MSVRRLDVWPPLSPGVYARKAVPALPFPLEERRCSLFERGRHALWHGLRALGLGRGDEVLVPAYHHGSEVEALVRAGIDCRFYDCGGALEPDETELEALVGPGTRALYLIHYLGFPQDVPRWRRFCDERGLRLIEDAAQAWLADVDGRPVGALGDIAIFCLYKTFGLPDGGALTGAAVPSPDRAASSGAGRLARRHAAWVFERSPPLAALAARLERPEPYSPEDDFALGDPDAPPSAATTFLLPRVADAGAAARRRANYRLLLDSLGDLVPQPFDALPPGASPFAFPVATDDKEALLGRLTNGGVRGLDFWSVPHPALPAERFARAAARRATLVGLPVHQELRRDDLARICRAVRPRPARRAQQVGLEPIESLDAARPEWSALAARSGNVFATWEWATTWWRHFGEGRPLRALACERGGRTVAILPLYRWASRPLRVLRLVGHGPADELGPVCAPADVGVAASALRRALADCDLLVAEQLRGDERWDALLGGRVLGREGSPVLHDPGGWEAYLASRSANLRQQIRRRERRLAEEHELGFRLADDAARLDDDLDTLFALHAAARNGRASAFGGEREAFHREFARCALEHGWLRLWLLELDGRPRAAWYGLRFGDVESYYQAGRDPACKDASVGFVLLAHSIRAALEDGVHEYRFLRGHEQFKYRFASADPGLQTVAVARTAVGAAALGAAAISRRGPAAAVRRRLVVA